MEIKTIDNSKEVVNDMPKLESPFVRQENKNGDYVVTPEIKEGYEWVFENDDVMAIEKLHGTNVSVIIEDGNITAVFNRKNRVPAFNKGRQYVTKGILNSINRGYLNLKDGQWYGELIGPKLHNNPHKVDKHLWIPFQSYSWNNLRYKSWGKYPKTYESISKWFKDGLFSLFYCNWHGVDIETSEKEGFVEGIVFTDPKTKRMAKLRRDMFDWYKGKRHKQ